MKPSREWARRALILLTLLLIAYLLLTYPPQPLPPEPLWLPPQPTKD